VIDLNVRVLTAPEIEPVSLEQARLWCKIDTDNTEDDPLLTILIQAARERAEELTGRAFVQRQLEAVYDRFPDSGKPIELPGAPLVSVEYVTYADTSGAWQTLSGSPDQWVLDTTRAPGRIQPPVGEDWPSAESGHVGAVKIGFTCGYAYSGSPSNDAQRDALPATLKTWMQLRLASFYENRESLVVGQAFQQPPRDFVDGLLDGLIVRKRFA